MTLLMLGVGFGLTGWWLGRKISGYEAALGYLPWFRDYGSPAAPWVSLLPAGGMVLYLAVILGTGLATVDPIVGSTTLSASYLLTGVVSYVRHRSTADR